MPSVLPPDIWNQIDRISRLQCCRAQNSERCAGVQHQGTLAVYAYDILNKAVMGSVHASRNIGLEDAIDEISKLTPADGQVRKSDVLEILNGLKWPTA